MNLLSSLVPGLRDLRTPLAVGYIWIAVLWILSPELPSTVTSNDLLNRVSQLGATVGPGGQLAALSFAAYLLGVLLEVVNRLVVTVCARVLRLVLYVVWASISFGIFGFTLYVPVQLATLAAHFYYVGIPVLIFMVLVLWIAHKRLSVDSIAVRALEHLVVVARESPERLLMRVEGAVKTLSTWARPGGHVIERFVSTRMSGIEPVAMGTYMAHLNNTSPFMLRYMARILEESPGVHRVGRTVQDLERLIRRTHTDVSALEELKLVLAGEMVRSSLVRSRIYSALMDSSGWYELIGEELADVATQLRSTHEGLYSDFDREKAESDFRLGVMVPAAALAACLTGYSLSSTSIPLSYRITAIVLVGLVVAAVLYIQGYGKRDEANRILVSSIETDRVRLMRPDIQNPNLVHVIRMSATGILDKPMTPLRQTQWLRWLLPYGLDSSSDDAEPAGLSCQDEGCSVHCVPDVPAGVQDARSTGAHGAAAAPALPTEVPGSRTPHG